MEHSGRVAGGQTAGRRDCGELWPCSCGWNRQSAHVQAGRGTTVARTGR